MIQSTEEERVKKATTIPCVFLDIGGVLLPNGWDHHARRRAAVTVQSAKAGDGQPVRAVSNIVEIEILPAEAQPGAAAPAPKGLEATDDYHRALARLQRPVPKGPSTELHELCIDAYTQGVMPERLAQKLQITSLKQAYGREVRRVPAVVSSTEEPDNHNQSRPFGFYPGRAENREFCAVPGFFDVHAGAPTVELAALDGKRAALAVRAARRLPGVRHLLQPEAV